MNWFPTANWGLSHGTWMSFNLTTGEPYDESRGWTSCMGLVNYSLYFESPECRVGQEKNRSCYQYPTPCEKITYQDIRSWTHDLASFGFSSMFYGNYWEYGWSCDGGDGDRAGTKTACLNGFGMPGHMYRPFRFHHFKLVDSDFRSLFLSSPQMVSAPIYLYPSATRSLIVTLPKKAKS